ncbi:MAG: PP2C family serine/threonine-protein phosphatase [Pseudomonadota bacterium]
MTSRAPEWVSVAARATGTGHVRRGERCQDALILRHAGSRIVLVVADGAGSAPHGGAGAAIACRTAARTALTMLGGDAPIAQTAAAGATSAAERLAQVGDRHAVAPRDLATTLIVAVADTDEVAVAHVGDGAAVVREEDSWRALSWPAAGDYAGTTYFLTDAAPEVRISGTGPVTGIAVLTDGLERLVLDHAAQSAHSPFFEMIARPLVACAPGRDRSLSAALARYLASDAVTQRTDDDTTLALAVRADR